MKSCIPYNHKIFISELFIFIFSYIHIFTTCMLLLFFYFFVCNCFFPRHINAHIYAWQPLKNSNLLLYLSFHLASLHRYFDSPYFLHVHLDSTHSHGDFPHPHSQLIFCILTIILHISHIPFPNSPF